MYGTKFRAFPQKLRSLRPLLQNQIRARSVDYTTRSVRGPTYSCATRPFSSSTSLNLASESVNQAGTDAERISRWISDLTSKPGKLSYDTIDVERASQLRRILPTRQDRPDTYAHDANAGDVLPCAHHLVYFRPKPMLRDLGKDGSSTEYNAPPPYTRRMWAGGKMMWSSDRTRMLRIGDEVTQVVRVPRVEFKKDMVFVQQQISIYSGKRFQDPEKTNEPGKDDWSVRELRTHVFRRTEPKVSSTADCPIPSAQADDDASADASASASAVQSAHPNIKAPNLLSRDSHEQDQKDVSRHVRVEAPDSVSSSEIQAPIPSISFTTSSSPSSVSVSFTYEPDTPLLFLYSALTHNPHKVHYDHPWTIHEEGHPAPLVHGPLTATLLVELAYAAGERQGKTLTKFEYRATSPMVIDREIRMSGKRREDGPSSRLDLSAEQGGKVGMTAVASFE
ncbi:hypothetical protein IAT40_007341 [Kwoniella sp. CBS 6097]